MKEGKILLQNKKRASIHIVKPQLFVCAEGAQAPVPKSSVQATASKFETRSKRGQDDIAEQEKSKHTSSQTPIDFYAGAHRRRFRSRRCRPRQACR